MKKRYRSFVFAWQGIRHCFAEGINFRLQLCCGAIACILGLLLHLSSPEWLSILICIAAVLSLEMINTAIENLCNLVHPGTHNAIKIIKDVAAGAVLVAATISMIIAAIIFIPKILSIGII